MITIFSTLRIFLQSPARFLFSAQRYAVWPDADTSRHNGFSVRLLVLAVVIFSSARVRADLDDALGQDPDEAAAIANVQRRKHQENRFRILQYGDTASSWWTMIRRTARGSLRRAWRGSRQRVGDPERARGLGRSIVAVAACSAERADPIFTGCDFCTSQVLKEGCRDRRCRSRAGRVPARCERVKWPLHSIMLSKFRTTTSARDGAQRSGLHHRIRAGGGTRSRAFRSKDYLGG